MKKDRITREYEKLFPVETPYDVISSALLTLGKRKDIDDLRAMLCKQLIRELSIAEGIYYYPSMRRVRKNLLFQVLKSNISMLPEEYCFQHMVYSLYIEDENSITKYFNRFVVQLEESGGTLDESFIVDYLIVPMKDAVPGFWKKAQRKIASLCKEDGTHELCKLMDKYYTNNDYEEDAECLAEYIGKYPTIIVAREYLAFTYENLKWWNNEIAILESLKVPMLYSYYMDQYYFDIAWAYGKIRNYKKEETNYRKALKINASMKNANNNLGYCLYRQGKYDEAEKQLKQCLDNGWDLSYAANNYVRVLIAEGKNRKAKAFIDSGGFKVSEALVTKTIELPKKDTKPSAFETRNNNTAGRKRKKEQFSSEKILEDELTARIESGNTVFGKKLKIYKRKGVYGRQFITDVGRFDLLCKDSRGNIYVIELKKDSGNNNVYQQITSYLDWLEKADEFSGKKIYGIICVNNPSNNLIEKVRKDDRLSLYEYQISYTEIK